MPNGKPGDHPLTDIIVHGIFEEYGKEASIAIKRISELSGRRELDEWWQKEIGWSSDKASILQKCKVKVAELEERAKSSGWEFTEKGNEN